MTLLGAEIRNDKLGRGGGTLQLRQRYCEAKGGDERTSASWPSSNDDSTTGKGGAKFSKIINTGGTDGFQRTLVLVVVTAAARERAPKACCWDTRVNRAEARQGHKAGGCCKVRL